MEICKNLGKSDVFNSGSTSSILATAAGGAVFFGFPMKTVTLSFSYSVLFLCIRFGSCSTPAQKSYILKKLTFL